MCQTIICQYHAYMLQIHNLQCFLIKSQRSKSDVSSQSEHHLVGGGSAKCPHCCYQFIIIYKELLLYLNVLKNSHK